MKNYTQKKINMLKKAQFNMKNSTIRRFRSVY